MQVEAVRVLPPDESSIPGLEFQVYPVEHDGFPEYSSIYITLMPMEPSPLARAISDLFWTFFPVFIVVLVLLLVGRLDNLLHRTDLILSAAVLFAEGWSRSRRVHREARDFLQFVGFVGALIAALLASMMILVEAGGITQLAPVIDSGRFAFFHYSLLLVSIIYGLLVRVVSYRRSYLLHDDNRPL